VVGPVPADQLPHSFSDVFRPAPTAAEVAAAAAAAIKAAAAATAHRAVFNAVRNRKKSAS
jgi:hypothetical protein